MKGSSSDHSEGKGASSQTRRRIGVEDLPVFVQRNSALPVHHQVTSQLKHLIRSGELEEGVRLPAGRELAEKLNVNRNTAQKIYEELEADGYVSSRQGSGTYVSKIVRDAPSEAARRRAEEEIRRVLLPLSRLLSPSDLSGIVNAELVRISAERGQRTTELLAARRGLSRWKPIREGIDDGDITD